MDHLRDLLSPRNIWSACYNRILWQIRQNPKMNPILPTLLGFAVLWASLGTLVAANPPGQSVSNQNRVRRSAEDGPNIEVLLASAVTAADSHTSIAAKIWQRIELFGQKLEGSGYYFQQGKGNQRRFRLELKIRVAEGISSFEQVCTGSDLWSREDLLSHTTLERIDLIRVRAVTAAQSSGPRSTFDRYRAASGWVAYLAG